MPQLIDVMTLEYGAPGPSARFVVDDRTATDVNKRGEPYSYLCTMLAWVLSGRQADLFDAAGHADHILLRLSGNVPCDGPILEWARENNLPAPRAVPERFLEVEIAKGQQDKLRTLAAAIAASPCERNHQRARKRAASAVERLATVLDGWV